MSLERSKYRNPPPPLGYVKKAPPDIVKKASKNEDKININTVIDMILASKICDEPDVSIYEHFIINSSSDEEIFEVPVISCQKDVEVLDIAHDVNFTPNKDAIPITIKKEIDSPPLPANDETSEDLVKDAKDSAVCKKIPLNTETGCDTNENFVQDKKHKKHDQVIKRKHMKKVKERRGSSDSYNSSSHYRSKYKKISKRKKKGSDSSDSDSHSRHKKRDIYRGGKDVRSRSRQKKKSSYSDDSDTLSSSRHKKRASFSSDSDTYISRHKKRASFSSDSDTRVSRHLKRGTSSEDSDTHRSQHQRRYSDSDTHSSSRHKRRSSCSGDSDTHSRSYSTGFHNKKISEKNDNSKLSGETSESKKNDFNKEDNDYKSKKSNSKKECKTDNSENTFVRVVRRRDTPSPSSTESHDKEYEETLKNIKKEPDLLYGQYKCPVCNVSVNNEITYRSHVNGKRHKKAVENAQNAGKILPKVPSNYPLPSQSSSKYPEPPPGYYRKKMDCLSLIQTDLDSKLRFPCPGLDKVTEIRGVTETSYYCAMCDCVSSSNCIIQHLSGFKHQLCSLKHFKRDLYERWNYKPKYHIEKDVISILETEEMKRGKGFIKVEKDVREADPGARTAKTSWRGHDKPSTSAQSRESEFFENYFYNSLPDPTKSGYYCKLCDSHCNSEAMWNSHIVGKRHLANLKKNPGTAPSKCKYIPAEPGTEPILYELLKNENTDHSPVIGLDQIREIRKPDINGVMYSCFLCGACVSQFDIVGHILTTKHREKYLAALQHPDLETLKGCAVSETYRASIIAEIAATVEAEMGTGRPEVYYTKSAFQR